MQVSCEFWKRRERVDVKKTDLCQRGFNGNHAGYDSFCESGLAGNSGMHS